jgi:hypothetical protein
MLLSLLALSLVDSINSCWAISSGGRLEARYANLRERLRAGARERMFWIFGLVGAGLLVTGVVKYFARFVMRPN